MRRRIWGAVCLGMCGVCFLTAILSIPHGSRDSFSASGRSGAFETPALPQGTVRINEADLEELMLLPGVGETLAQAILDERAAHGPFYYPEDLISVRGIGASKLEKLAPWLNFD